MRYHKLSQTFSLADATQSGNPQPHPGDRGQVLLRQLGVAGSVAGFDALGQGVDVWQLLQA